MRIGLVLLAGAVLGVGQGITVRGPEPAVVTLGGRAAVVIEVAGAARGVALGPLPVVPGLRMTVRAPMTTSEGTRLEVELEPLRPGTFAIPEFTVELGASQAPAPCGVLEVRRDEEAERQGFVEIRTVRTTCYVGEAVTLDLRFGLDRGFLERNLIPLFPQKLDVPVQVRAPGLLERSTSVAGDPVGGTTATFVLGDRPATGIVGEETREGGRPFTVVRHRRELVPAEAGTLALDGPSLRFAYATAFEEHFITGRRPKDRKSGYVLGSGLSLEVRPVPVEGRPAGFRGAVGRFTLRARLATSEVSVGEPFSLALDVGGAGNLASVDPPDLRGLAGFHVLGVLEKARIDQTPPTRTFLYDLVATRPDITAVPPLALTFFDPEPPAGFRTATTEAMPLLVRSDRPPRAVASAGVPNDGRPERGGGGGEDLEAEDASEGWSTARLLKVLVPVGLLLLVALALVATRTRGSLVPRGRAPDALPAPPAPRPATATRNPGAREAPHTRPSSVVEPPPTDPAGRLAVALAARLGCTRWSVIGPGLQARLVGVGVSEDLAREASVLLERLVAAGYGGVRDPADAGRAEDLVRRLGQEPGRGEG